MSTLVKSFAGANSLVRMLLPAVAMLTLLGGCIAYPAPQQIYDEPQRSYDPPPQYSQSAGNYDSAVPGDNGRDPQYDSQPEVEVRVAIAPPPLPEYDQPPCPEYGYLWTPGYWGYGGGGYYWVPGTWVQPPQVGVLWTPGYWGFSTGFYLFHPGYWGPHVGFYGGVNYGGGYVGRGYVGGRWENNRFSYNRAVNNVNTTIIHNTYNQTVVNNITVNRVSYNGGRGGVAAAPTGDELQASRGRHIPPPTQQLRHINEARQNPAMYATYNQGRPPIAATPRAAAFNAPNVISARGAPPLPLNRPAGAAESRPTNRGERVEAGAGQAQFERPSNQGAPTPLPTQRPQPQINGSQQRFQAPQQPGTQIQPPYARPQTPNGGFQQRFDRPQGDARPQQYQRPQPPAIAPPQQFRQPPPQAVPAQPQVQRRAPQPVQPHQSQAQAQPRQAPPQAVTPQAQRSRPDIRGRDPEHQNQTP